MIKKQYIEIIKHYQHLLSGPSEIYIKNNYKILRATAIGVYLILIFIALFFSRQEILPFFIFNILFIIASFILLLLTSTLTIIFTSSLVMLGVLFVNLSHALSFFAVWIFFLFITTSWSIAKNSLIEKNNISKKFQKIISSTSDTNYKLFSNLGHELRNPLSVIIGFTDFLIPWAKENDHMQESYFLQMIKKNSLTLLNILTSILEFTKLETKHYKSNKSFVDLKALFTNLETKFKERANEQGVQLLFQLENSIKEELFLDESSINLILEQLIDNSFKFTNHGKIEINASITRVNNKIHDDLVIVVKDTGTGINESDKENIFKPFFQMGKGLTKAGGGIGLGLPIVNKVIKIIDGKININSDSSGTEITLVIPTLIGEVSLPNFELNNDYDSEQKISKEKHETILVVEDLKDNRYLLRKLLKKMNFDVIEAENGKEAIDIISNPQRGKVVSAVFMDMQMPVLNGYKATKILRRKGFRLPIIALTAKNLQEDIDNFLKNGCNDYLPKPFELPQLQKIVQKIVKHKY